MPNFINTSPVGAELFYAEGRTDIQTDRLYEDCKRKCSVKFTIEKALKTQRKEAYLYSSFNLGARWV